MIKGSDWQTTYGGRGLLQAATDGDEAAAAVLHADLLLTELERTK